MQRLAPFAYQKPLRRRWYHVATIRYGQSADPRYFVQACWMVRQTRSGVAGMSR
jgi:hypothetical protein